MLKCLLTNWVHLLGFYIGVEMFIIINMVMRPDASNNLNATLAALLLSAPFLMFTYGLIIITAFLLAIVVFDLVLFSVIKHRTLLIMLIEWLLIVPIFIYWAFKYDYWLWIILSATFLVTQFIRSKKIDKIASNV